MKMWGVGRERGGVYTFYCIYTYTNGMLLSHEKNEILSLVATWMDLEHIVLNKISQRKPTTV